MAQTQKLCLISKLQMIGLPSRNVWSKLYPGCIPQGSCHWVLVEMWNKVHGKVSESSQNPRIMHTVTYPHNPFHYRGGWGCILGPAPGLVLELLGRADAPPGSSAPCWGHSVFCLNHSQPQAFPGGANGKEPTCQCKRHKRQGVQSLGWEDPLEKEIETQSSILAWEIPWTEEPGATVHRDAKSLTRPKRLS